MAINIVGVDLLPWQQEVFDVFTEDNYKGHRTIVINNSRQIGKSLLLTQLILYTAINNNNYTLGVCSLTFRQTRKLYNEITEFINKVPGLVLSNNKSELTIKLYNNTQIIFLSAQNADSVRGNSFDAAFLDEMAYYPEGVYEKVILPTTMAKGKVTVITSTPRGTSNSFYRLFMMGLNEQVKNVISFKFDWTYGFFKEEEIELIKQTIPPAVFRQEFCAEFSDNGSVFNNVSTIATIDKFEPPKPNVKYYIGVDCALYQDYTVAIVMDQYGNVVDIFRERSGSMANMQQSIEKLIKRWNPKRVLIETNSFGISLYEYLHLKFRSIIEGFKTTSSSKPELIQLLQKKIEQKEIAIPHFTFDKIIYDELNNFSFTYSAKSKQIIYGAMSGHDDAVMALGLVTKLVHDYHSVEAKPKLGYKIR